MGKVLKNVQEHTRLRYVVKSLPGASPIDEARKTSQCCLPGTDVESGRITTWSARLQICGEED